MAGRRKIEILIFFDLKYVTFNDISLFSFHAPQALEEERRSRFKERQTEEVMVN